MRRLKKAWRVLITTGSLSAALKALGGFMVYFWVAVAILTVAGIMYGGYKGKKKWEEILRQREQAITNAVEETNYLIVPPGPEGWSIDTTNVVVTDRLHFLVWEEDPPAGPPPLLSVSLLHPVVWAHLTPEKLTLSISNDAGWVNSGVSLTDEYGLPRADLDGPSPMADFTFDLQRSVDLETWTIVFSDMGVSSNTPSFFRDEEVTWGYPQVFYRVSALGR